MTGQSPPSWSAAIRRARSASKATDADTDSAVTASAVPSRPARSAACRVIAADQRRPARRRSRSARPATRSPATAPRWCRWAPTSTRPKVARSPASRACLLAASAVIA